MRHDNRDLESWHLLLKAKIAVRGYEDIKFCLGVSKQIAIP